MTRLATPAAEIRRIGADTDSRELAAATYRRLLIELDRLSTEDWGAPTICDPWTVADIVRHLLGAAKAHGSLRELARQARVASRTKDRFDGNDMDAMNELQVADHRHLGPAELVAGLEDAYPAAVAHRFRVAPWFGWVPMPLSDDGSTPAGSPDRLSLGHLFTTVLTRDVFLHRVDIARATGRGMEVSAEVEGRIVADVVGEWAERHGRPFHLELTGPAGGTYRQGEGGPELSLDALQLCFELSGRAEASHPLMETRVFF